MAWVSRYSVFFLVVRTPEQDHKKKRGSGLLLGGLGASLGRLATSSGFVNLLDTLDNTDSNGLPHITDSKATERREFGVGFNTHGLGRNHLNNSRVTRLDKLGVVLKLLARTTIDLLNQLGELAGNVSSVAIEHWRVTSTNLTGVVEYNDLGLEGGGLLGRIVLGVGADEATTNFLDRDVLNVETNVVAGYTFSELFVVHFNRLHFSGDTRGGEADNHTSL